MMINLDNFQVVEDWPSTAFLMGSDILPHDLFHALLTYDYKDLQGFKGFEVRKALTSEQLFEKGPSHPLYAPMKQLHDYLSDIGTLEQFVTKAFEQHGFDRSIERFWTQGFESMRLVYRGVFFQIAEDNADLNMSPHVDHRDVLANMQVYIGDEGHDNGTVFYRHNDYRESRMVPFRNNGGYFQVNTNQGVHSVKNVPGVTRRTLIISWL